MPKQYTSYLLLLFFASCTTRITYIGSSSKPTQQVDVFVDESSVKKQYEIVGKGYTHTGLFTKVEMIQTKAVAQAKKKGANAVLIKDYYIPNTGAAINSITRTDSVGRGAISIGSATVQQTGSSGFTVLFLKYK